MTAVDAAPVEVPPAPAPPRSSGTTRVRVALGWLAGLVTIVAGSAVAGAVGAGGAGALVAMVLLAPVAHDAVARPTFRRLALRNASRRRGEAALVVLGSLLGTAIIVASLVVGDTITASLRDLARTRLGPIDVTVEVLEADLLTDVAAAVTADPPAGVDGLLELVSASAAAANDDPDRPRGAPSVALVELDFDEARAFGSDPGITGMADAGATPGPDEAVINERLADELEVGEGDTIRVFAYGYGLPLVVRDVIPEVGIAGYAASAGNGLQAAATAPVFVAPGTIEPIAALSTVPMASPPAGQLLVSNDGGVFDSVDPAVADRLATLVADIPGAEVQDRKADTLEDAEEGGAEIQELYSGIGMFSVIAGILLLVNLFVMLADERKVQLGMLRSLGFRRNHLCRSFAIEGASYAALAAALGAVAGIAVGWAITRIASQIFQAGDAGIVYRLHVEVSSLVAGALTGLVISLLTVWVTSARIARLNVIAAIRDLPDPRKAHHGRAGLVLGVLGVVLGVVLFQSGYTATRPEAVMLGPALALFSLIPVLTRVAPRKPVVILLSGGVIAWTVTVFTFFPDVMGTSDIPVFVLMGVLLVGASVAIASQVDHLWVALNDRLSGGGLLSRFGGGLSARLGLAYPLARKFRTGMLLGMYAIVIFTMTFMSAFIGIFADQAPSFTEDLAGGFDVWLESSPGNPVTVEQLLEQPEVDAVSPLLFGLAEYRAEGEADEFPLTGFDESLLTHGGLGLDTRDPAYASDLEVFEAVLADDSLVVVNDWFLQGGGGPPEELVGVGDVIEVENPATGEIREVTVAGVLGADFVYHGVLAGAPFVDDFLGPLAGRFRHYVQVAPGEDPEAVAETLTGRFIANGADGTTFDERVRSQLQQTQSFFGLMRGYLGLGLLIGIAGLGVVMVRAVRERRREIGMLRAMGFSARVVRRAFLVEAAFIAVQGSVIGIGLGMLTAYQVVVNSTTFGEQELPFQVPWSSLALVLVVPLVASLAAAAAPATQAARIKPAVALRVAD